MTMDGKNIEFNIKCKCPHKNIIYKNKKRNCTSTCGVNEAQGTCLCKFFCGHALTTDINNKNLHFLWQRIHFFNPMSPDRLCICNKCNLKSAENFDFLRILALMNVRILRIRKYSKTGVNLLYYLCIQIFNCETFV